ncbi:MAG TPA: hypothetical protein VIN93_11175 [Bryobacteraceae bacterium]
MKIRFQADADIDPDIRKGLLRRAPSIDFRPAAATIPDGTLDAEVLRIAAEDGRVLVSGDLRTMGIHFHGFAATQDSPGVLLIPSSRSIGAAKEGLFFVWLNWTPDDLRNRVQWLP